ncbi:cyclic pyranopterin phosphate synthase [Anaerotaenia torta]|uniref:cyclic pyranopterin monophosphate synthase MoaC n=1 Tax=Anaerotaenia torta TaxID=433293 RepID=UPI003D239143
MKELTHFDQRGNAVMVDVSEKDSTQRTAVAKGTIRVSREVFTAIKEGTSKKGDVLGVARVAGIMAAKKTWELIPMCHVLTLEKCSVDFELKEEVLEVEAACLVKTTGKTGVEMEALTGVNIALLTIYDMCKAIDKTMVIGEVYLYRKTGGKSGDVMNNKGSRGIVRAVCISEARGTQKKNVKEARFLAGHGIEGDAHAGNWHRQVSLLSYEKIEEFNARGAEVEDGAFGENLVVEGFDFAALPVGTRLQCGQVLLEITQIGKECHNHCQIYEKMGECIMPKQGIFARVLQGGTIGIGDEMRIV